MNTSQSVPISHHEELVAGFIVGRAHGARVQGWCGVSVRGWCVGLMSEISVQGLCAGSCKLRVQGQHAGSSGSPPLPAITSISYLIRRCHACLMSQFWSRDAPADIWEGSSPKNI